VAKYVAALDEGLVFVTKALYPKHKRPSRIGLKIVQNNDSASQYRHHVGSCHESGTHQHHFIKHILLLEVCQELNRKCWDFEKVWQVYFIHTRYSSPTISQANLGLPFL
jgi:hypothetical protein